MSGIKDLEASRWVSKHISIALEIVHREVDPRLCPNILISVLTTDARSAFGQPTTLFRRDVNPHKTPFAVLAMCYYRMLVLLDEAFLLAKLTLLSLLLFDSYNCQRLLHVIFIYLHTAGDTHARRHSYTGVGTADDDDHSSHRKERLLLQP